MNKIFLKTYEQYHENVKIEFRKLFELNEI